jgi:hypothetical protein
MKDEARILHEAKRYLPGDVITAEEISNIAKTAVEAYRLLALGLLKAHPFDWEKLRDKFSVDEAGVLWLDYTGDDITFNLCQTTGELTAHLPIVKE